MTLVNDPQAFAERLFHRLQMGSALTFETKMLLISVLSRVVGLHRLHLLHLYPFLQRYAAEPARTSPSSGGVRHGVPRARARRTRRTPVETTREPVRARSRETRGGRGGHKHGPGNLPAVPAGDVRGPCCRTWRSTNAARDKPVAVAARALISLFPPNWRSGMLEKKDRGKVRFFLFFVFFFQVTPSEHGFDRASRRFGVDSAVAQYPGSAPGHAANDEKIIRREAFIT